MVGEARRFRRGLAPRAYSSLMLLCARGRESAQKNLRQSFHLADFSVANLWALHVARSRALRACEQKRTADPLVVGTQRASGISAEIGSRTAGNNQT